jgi:hypothetical protein
MNNVYYGFGGEWLTVVINNALRWLLINRYIKPTRNQKTESGTGVFQASYVYTYTDSSNTVN